LQSYVKRWGCFRLYCFGIEGSRDISNAKESSKLLGIESSINILSLDRVKELLPDLILASEESEN